MQEYESGAGSETLDTWPLAGSYQLRWSRGEDGEMWVTVENGDGVLRDTLPYQTYLDMEVSRAMRR